MYNFIDKAIKVHSNKFDYTSTTYVNMKTKVTIKCNQCNVIYQQLPGNHLKGMGCFNCRVISSKLSLEQLLERSIKIHKNRYNYDKVKYENYKTKVEILCNSCKKTFLQTPDSHLNGGGCKCYYYKLIQKQNEMEFYKKAASVHNNKYDYSLVEYINALTKVKIKCLQCKNVFEQKPGDHVFGNGCPNCKFSKGENACMKVLKDHTAVFEILPQYKYDDCKNIFPLLFDFKVVLNNDKFFMIEYQGKQHFTTNSWFSENLELIQKRDKIKTDYCSNKQIPLLIIHYKDFNTIENIINNFINKLLM